MSSYLEMGGYAVFVWSAYGICMTVLLANVVWVRIQRKKIFRQLKSYFLRSST